MENPLERKLIWNLLCPIPCENKTMQTSKCPEMRIVSRLAGTARHYMERASWLSGPYVSYTIDIVAILGGFVILLIGLTLISSAFGQQHPIIGM